MGRFNGHGLGNIMQLNSRMEMKWIYGISLLTCTTYCISIILLIPNYST